MKRLALLLVLIAGNSLAAPLPLKRPLPPRKVYTLTPRLLAGRWEMTWQGTLWRVTLTEGGAYWCSQSPPKFWVGVCTLTTEGLEVDEQYHPQPSHPPEQWCIWRVRWKRDHRGRLDANDLRGTIDNWSEFRLRRKR